MRHFLKWVVPCALVLGTALYADGQGIISANAKATVFLPVGAKQPNDESAPSFTQDGKMLCLTDSNTVRFSKLVNGKWTKPVIASFSGKWHDWDAFISPDGKRVIFVSNRPLPGMPQDLPQKGAHLWYVDHLKDGEWTAPKHFDAPVNLDGTNDFGPSMSRSGTICFCSRNRDGHKGMGAYYCKWLGDHYDTPKQLALNGGSDIFDPFIAPDESYIVFASDKNIYISYRIGDGWSQGEKLSAQVNNGNWNGGPYISPDGKTLYYSQDHAPGIMMIPVHIAEAVN